MKMLMDPCKAELVPGFFATSEGYLTKTRSSVNINQPGGAGYAIWVPTFHGSSQPGSGGNLFVFQGDSITSPSNSGAAPYGSPKTMGDAYIKSTAAGFADPAFNFVASGAVSNARTISACMRLTYIGQMQSASGQVAFLHNIPIQELTGVVPFGAIPGTPMSVDLMFQMATNVQRLGVDTLEVKHRISDSLHDTFRNQGDELIDIGNVSESFLDPTAETTSHNAFGFAWRGLAPGDPANLALDFYKNIEWKPGAAQGLTHVQPKQSAPGVPSGVLAQGLLDKVRPGWESEIVSSASSAIGYLAKAVFAGA